MKKLRFCLSLAALILIALATSSCYYPYSYGSGYYGTSYRGSSIGIGISAPPLAYGRVYHSYTRPSYGYSYYRRPSHSYYTRPSYSYYRRASYRYW